MAFDYGSIDLGLRNPFKLEGSVTAVRGAVQSGIGVWLLITSAGMVKDSPAAGWILMIFGILLLAGGLVALSSGVYAMLRYFVGRNHPTSLALNRSRSETSTAQQEASFVGYSAQQLEEMLMGRKNSTFVEPVGILARLVHSLFPRLLYMPYPIRNMAQRLFGAWVNTLVMLVSYGLVAFVSLAGFAGEVGEMAFPVYSIVLMLYLLYLWMAAGRAINRAAEHKISSLGGASLVKIIVISLFLPVLTALAIGWLLPQFRLTPVEVQEWIEQLPALHVGAYLAAIFALALIATLLIVVMLKRRLAAVNPVTEVSELRENWQESIHPNEIFINLDNLVMANRRYKEVPNRVYRELDPQLNEQVEGKGSFRGEMLQEIQPKVMPLELGAWFKKSRLAALVMGNLLFIASAVLVYFLAYQAVDFYAYIESASGDFSAQFTDSGKLLLLVDQGMPIVHFILLVILLKAFANLLANAAHLFFAEIQFDSLLVYFKCEGTFTESKISTGMSIHDSTRSENTLVRSSITPWVVVSRIVSTTFAATGLRNLEHPRHILELHRAEDELQAIKNDVVAFLKDRESIASITSERDLGNASQVHQLNQQTRAIPEHRLEQDEEAAGYLRQEQDRLEQKKDSPD